METRASLLCDGNLGGKKPNQNLGNQIALFLTDRVFCTIVVTSEAENFPPGLYILKGPIQKSAKDLGVGWLKEALGSSSNKEGSRLIPGERDKGPWWVQALGQIESSQIFISITDQHTKI